MGQTLRSDCDMTLDAGNFFAGIITLLFGAVGVFYALGINDQKAGQAVAPLFGAGLANQFFLTPAPVR
jgi:hypothetical protein